MLFPKYIGSLPMKGFVIGLEGGKDDSFQHHVKVGKL